jgi:hypothetical protein
MKIIENHSKTITARVEYSKNKTRVSKVENIKLKSALKSVVLPLGYPYSVSPDYTKYQIWDTIQAFCSSLVGLLSTRSLLEGYGVGDQNSSIYSAVLTWLLRNGVGMITQLIFVWISGEAFQRNIKPWRFAADIVNDLGFLADFISIAVPKPFFPWIASISMILKTCTSIIGSATKFELTNHFAISNNAIDLNAKDGSQETMVNLLTMIPGWFMMQSLSTLCDPSKHSDCKSKETPYVWLLFVILSLIHLFSNYVAVRSVILRKINRHRAHLLLDHFIKYKNVLNPTEISQKESLLSVLFQKDGIYLGDSVTKDCSCVKSICESKDDYYILKHKNGYISVFFEEGFDSDKILIVYFIALLIKSFGFNQKQANKFLKETDFIKQLSSRGWSLSPDSIGVDFYRFERHY